MYYPVFLRLENQRAVVVGGGRVAERKVRRLLEAGAVVTVVSPELTRGLLELADFGKIIHAARKYRRGDLRGALLAFSATGDEAVDRKVAEDAAARGILVNVASELETSSFIVPASMSRGDFEIAVSTGGSSPELAKEVAEELKKRYGPEYGKTCEMLKRVRNRVKTEFPEPDRREMALRCLGQSEVLRYAKEGREIMIEERLRKCMSSQ